MPEGNYKIINKDNNGNLVLESGNLGIGTTTPQKKLEIFSADGQNMANDSTTAQLRIGGSSSHFTDIKHGPINNVGNFALQFFVRDAHTGNQESETLTAPRMSIGANGNVGIGTTSPTALLTVGDPSVIDTNNKLIVAPGFPGTGKEIHIGSWSDTQNVDYCRIQASTNLHIDPPSGGETYINWYTTRRTNIKNGLVIHGGNSFSYYGYVGMLSKDRRSENWLGTFGWSVWVDADLNADHVMVRGSVHTYSDKRIKKDITLINDDIALNRVNQLESYEYNYMDPLRKKPMKTIGFIAQEVKEVIPNAVTIEKDYIPDEIRIIDEPKWTEYDGKYYLDIPDLDMSGNFTGKGKFYVSNDISGNDEIYKEVNIKKIPSISINYVGEFDESWNNVFFYGKEVDDFHTVDKQQIFALHHSAIQELSRKNDAKDLKIQVLETENNNKTQEITELKEKLQIMEADMALVKQKLGL